MPGHDDNLGPLPAGQLPDLLYPSERRRRIEAARDVIGRAPDAVPATIDRITVFTTFRCNLSCRYCNTIRKPEGRDWPAWGEEYDLGLFTELLDRLAPSTIRHIHFTGGEATLVRDLPAMVELAAGRGIPCSLTSNGTADPALYDELVARGLREVRVSCDTHVPAMFDHIVGRRGAYQRVIDTIRELGRLRDEEHERLCVIVNMCVGYENRSEIAEFVKESIALGPDDVKLLSVSTQRDDLGQFEERTRVLNEIRAQIARRPEGSLPLLRHKLTTVFSSDACGFKDLTSHKLMRRCFVPLTERTVDARWCYPCPVYVREGGKPLARLDDDAATQQLKISEFVDAANCYEDEICHQYCINCCKKFNLFANAELDPCVRGKDGTIEPFTAVIDSPDDVTDREIIEQMRRIERERAGFDREIPYRPFMVIKPGGTPHREDVLAILRTGGASVAESRPIPDWNDVAMRLYSVPLTEDKVARGIVLARALPRAEESSVGELLLLEGDLGIERLAELKREIRDWIGPTNYLIKFTDHLLVTSQGYIHTPSPETYWIEANLLLD